MIMQFWYSKNVKSFILLPLAFLYYVIISLRKFIYKIGLKKAKHFSVPVIIVGNITVGGTGKTPLVIWLAHLLKQQGFKPGIVSRGYGGKTEHYPLTVIPQSVVTKTGDEALLIARNTQCPVVIDPRRINAVQTLLQNTECDIVISDDGLQHYALGRSIEIAVIDGARRFGNGFYLPAGPLRESVDRLASVDFVVSNGIAQTHEYAMQLMVNQFNQVTQPDVKVDANFFINKNIHAVAGIGNPSRFFATLRQLGLTIIEHPFPDHYLFKRTDFNYGDDAIIVMTEKDAVKCEQFANQNFWYLPVQAEVAGLEQVLLAKLKHL